MYELLLKINPVQKYKLEIIAKAFKTTLEQLIIEILNKEINYIESLLDSEQSTKGLEEYYEREISYNEIQKLTIVEDFFK